MPAFPTSEIEKAMRVAFPEFRPRIIGNDRITFLRDDNATIIMNGFTWISGDGGRVEATYIDVQISGQPKFNTRADSMEEIMKKIRSKIHDKEANDL